MKSHTAFLIHPHLLRKMWEKTQMDNNMGFEFPKKLLEPKLKSRFHLLLNLNLYYEVSVIFSAESQIMAAEELKEKEALEKMQIEQPQVFMFDDSTHTPFGAVPFTDFIDNPYGEKALIAFRCYDEYFMGNDYSILKVLVKKNFWGTAFAYFDKVIAEEDVDAKIAESAMKYIVYLFKKEYQSLRMPD